MESQTQKINLWLPRENGGGRDKLGDWDWHIHPTIYINNLRYADDTTLMAESEEELKGLLMSVKEESEKLA